MKICNDYLNELATLDRKNGGTGSDYKLAQLLGVKRQKMSYFRRNPLDDDTCLVLADQLGISVFEITSARNAERTKSPAMKKRWQDVARSAAAVLALGITGLMAHPGTVEAASSQTTGNGQYYTLCEVDYYGYGD